MVGCLEQQGSSGHSSSCVTSELIRSEDSEVLERPAAADNVVFLPKDMWTVLKDSGSGGSIVETGWLVQRDLALVSVCEFESSNKPKVSCQSASISYHVKMIWVLNELIYICSSFKPPHQLQACTQNLLNMESLLYKSINSRP